jgi:hypothetical protein
MHGIPLWLRSADVAAAVAFMLSVGGGLIDGAHAKVWLPVISIAFACHIAFVCVGAALSLFS